MAEMNWEKSKAAGVKNPASNRSRFAIVGLVIIGAMAFMIMSATITGGRFFITVNDVVTRTDLAGKTVKMTGAVIGESIRFDPNTQTIYFTVAHVTDDMGEIERGGGLAQVLHRAVNDPTVQRLDVVVRNQPVPDLLQNEAQAIMTGKLGADGLFYADELQLKCPSKYESGVPKQAAQAK